MITKVGLPRVDDEKVQRALDVLATLVNKLPDVAILNGRLLKNVEVASTADPTKVAHGLGRTPQGWFVARVDTLGANPMEISRDSLFLTLDAPATITVDLWVF